MTITLDDRTVASHPGGVALQPLRYLIHRPKVPLIMAAVLAGSIALAVLVSAWFTILVVLVGLVNLLYWWRLSESFKHGCLNTAVVVSVKPTLVAVHTDLSKGEGEYPVVKIVAGRVPIVGRRELRVGDRVPHIATYYGLVDDDLPHWEDFFPKPASCATSDTAAIDELITRYEEEDWQEFERDLAQVPEPYTPGLYPIGWVMEKKSAD